MFPLSSSASFIYAFLYEIVWIVSSLFINAKKPQTRNPSSTSGKGTHLPVYGLRTTARDAYHSMGRRNILTHAPQIFSADHSDHSSPIGVVVSGVFYTRVVPFLRLLCAGNR
ncbi:hypothetical protein PT974_03884 [Cladobotryum mycophilum]|uniref:Uncharacterized protein n=1 Tax=Cladobotryum mycophilum TaxID=491253 RepID=A0ABR0SUN4_9HYPO